MFMSHYATEVCKCPEKFLTEKLFVTSLTGVEPTIQEHIVLIKTTKQYPVSVARKLKILTFVEPSP